MPVNPYLGELMTVAFNFAPRGWALCDGQLLPIASNTALFSLLGTAFGGDGRTTFALPDLRGRAGVGVGNGAGLPNITWGQRGGSTEFTLTVAEIPSHTHTIRGTNNDGNTNDPANALFAKTGFGDNEYAIGKSANSNMQSDMAANTGGGQSVQKRSPYLGLYQCISLQGIFPSRS